MNFVNRLRGLQHDGRLAVAGWVSIDSAYAAEVVRADFQEAGDEDVVRKLVADLGGKADAAAVRQRLQAAMAEAQGQMLGEAR